MKFIVDVMLGRLAKLLRMLGHDTVYFSQGDELKLLKIAREQKRVLLTRRSALRVNKGSQELLFVTDDNSWNQLRQVIHELKLTPSDRSIFTVCLVCNERLIAIAKEVAAEVVPEYILNTYDSFYMCPNCKRIYWPGTHHNRMLRNMVYLRDSEDINPQ